MAAAEHDPPLAQPGAVVAGGAWFPADGEERNDLPAASLHIRLLAEAPGEVAWSCGTPTIDGNGGVQLHPGRHILKATDSGTGRQAETWIKVIGL